LAPGRFLVVSATSRRAQVVNPKVRGRAAKPAAHIAIRFRQPGLTVQFPEDIVRKLFSKTAVAH
jgi:hypothetical protein